MSARNPNSTLIAVAIDGDVRVISNSYEGIKLGLDQACMDFVIVSETAAFYIDDEGMLNGSPLNMAASMFAGRPIYGPVVLCYADADDEGDTVPALDEDVRLIRALAARWYSVMLNATVVGQDVTVRANPDTIPPPTIVSMDDAQFEAWMQEGRG